MKPALASFGKLVIEAAMPQINIPKFMPKLNLGTEMAQRFREVYQVPNVALQSVTQLTGTQNMIKSSVLDLSYVNSMNRIINSPGMRVAEQANRMKAMFEVPKMAKVKTVMDAVNSPSMIVARQIAEQNNRISQVIPTVPLLSHELSQTENSPQDDEISSTVDLDDEKNQEKD